jgi:hypothetical protein
MYAADLASVATLRHHPQRIGSPSRRYRLSS